MRNLRIVSLDETELSNGLLLTATAWDASNDSIICAFGPTPVQPIIELKRKARKTSTVSSTSEVENSSFQTITSWDAPCPLPELECDEILLLQYFSDTNIACIVLAGGDLVVVREHPLPDEERIEIVGSVDVGIAAAAWAPDEELLAIVTRDDNLILMSRGFDLVNETRLVVEDLKASKHVSVGWGKKETQFHGKRARAMRDPTMPEQIDEGKSSPKDDGRTLISWRGDGSYLAVNSIVRDHRRVIRVFTREGVLDSASEPVDGLESAISWRPAGNLIAGIKRSTDKLEVSFFERNGLRHGHFDLRLSTSDLTRTTSSIDLAWNIDSTILAVTFLDRVQLWTMGNYHYYLKQEIIVDNHSSTSAPPYVRWHSENPLKFAIWSQHRILDVSCILNVTRGSTIPPHDYGIVAVIDGKSLKLTPMKHVGVPPPSSFCEVQVENPIVDCAVSKDGRRLAILTSTSIDICDWQMRSEKPASKSNGQVDEKLRHTLTISKHSIPLNKDHEARRFTQIVFQDNHETFSLSPPESDKPAICQRLLINDDGSMSEYEDVVIHPQTQTLVSDTQQNSVWSSNFDNTTLITDTDRGADAYDKTQLDGAEANFAIFPMTLHSEATTNGYHDDFEYHKISLSRKGNLLVDNHTLTRDCTSFIVTKAHLIFTTTQHLLKFVHLTKPTEMQVPPDTPEVDERCRSIERGAKIVTVIPSSYAVVLQMPRGNLETIYPRVLVVSGIRQHIINEDYLSAFIACQTHQVDMNILYDFRPDAFIANVPKIISQLKKSNRIDEFLSKLKEEDVTQTLYRDTLNDASIGNKNDTSDATKAKLPGQNKVNRICDAFLLAFRSQSTTHLQNTVTAHVCKRPPDLTSALTLVSSLRRTSAEDADVAVSHLCFLTDVNRLFDAALALYDLELTLLVAQNSQRDPREYMPFLQSLQELPELRRRFRIDDHLRNHAKAVASLHELKEHEEVEAYTVKHGLYTNVIALYNTDDTHRNNITKLYAQHLSSQSRHSQAATLFESLQDYASAYPLYALAHQWRESLSCASLLPLQPERLQTHAASLATTCADELRDYRAAATIQLEYLHDIPSAARSLCKGSYFADAIRILALHNQSHEIRHIIDNGLTEKFGEIIELVADCKSQLTAQLPRISELRQKKEEDPLAFYGGDAALAQADGVDIPDNISLAPTDATTLGGQSLFTRYGSNASKFGGTVASNVSRKTSKTKRREERKRARGKKGSVYEEEYLVGSVGRLIERVNGVQDEVKRLISGLLRRGMREQAAKVDEVMLDISRACGEARNEVWQQEKDERGLHGAEEREETSTYAVNGEGRPTGADGVLWDSQMELGGLSKKEAPSVKTWISNEVIAS